MRKFIILILSFLLLIGKPLNSHADGIDIIYDILNKPTTSTTGEDIIYGILGKNNPEVEVQIVGKDTIDNELESENKSTDDDAYIKGLDVSKWNGIVNWKSVKKAGIDFVIFRAGYGPNANSDKYFEQNIKGAIENNMIIGIYWFSYAYTDDMAVNEAKQCIKTIEKYKHKIALPIFYDFEYDSVKYANSKGVRINKSKASSLADSFCSTIKKHGYETGIYTNIDYSNRYFTDKVLEKYHTWIAQWTSKCTYKNNYIIWQKSDSYYINNKKFDLNYFYFNRYKDLK